MSLVSFGVAHLMWLQCHFEIIARSETVFRLASSVDMSLWPILQAEVDPLRLALIAGLRYPKRQAFSECGDSFLHRARSQATRFWPRISAPALASPLESLHRRFSLLVPSLGQNRHPEPRQRGHGRSSPDESPVRQSGHPIPNRWSTETAPRSPYPAGQPEQPRAAAHRLFVRIE